MKSNRRFWKGSLAWVLSAMLLFTGIFTFDIYADEPQDMTGSPGVTAPANGNNEEITNGTGPNDGDNTPDNGDGEDNLNGQDPAAGGDGDEEPRQPEEPGQDPENPDNPGEGEENQNQEPVENDFQVSGLTLPTTLTYKQNFTVQGSIHSNLPITHVKVVITDLDGTAIRGHLYDEDITTRDFKLATANASVKFNTLPAGKYRYCVYVTTDKNDPDSNELVNKQFTVKHKTGKTLANDNNPLTFKKAVAIDQRLKGKANPVAYLTGNAASISLKWNDCKKAGADIDGYIILRRVRTAKKYTELTRVNADTVTYLDKTATAKNCFYGYAIMSYKKDKDGSIVVSSADLIDGVTTKSRLPNPYKITLSHTKKTLQVGGTFTLKATFPRKSHHDTWIRWSSSDKNVATVSSNGKVTAVAPGTAAITARVCNGRKFTCKVTVITAFKPATPSLSLDYGTNTSITIKWKKANHALHYQVWSSKLERGTWTEPVRLTSTRKTAYTHKNLTKGDRYRYYIIAVNKNAGTTKHSGKSNVLTQEVKITRVKTKVTGWPKTATAKSRINYRPTIRITAPAGRTMEIQLYQNGNWVTKKTQKLPAGSGTVSVKVAFPNDWWTKTSSSWRIKLPKTNQATAYSSKTLKIKTRRAYQNPAGYYQIQSSIPTRATTYNLYTGQNGYKVWLVQRKLNAYSGDYKGYTSDTAKAVSKWQRNHGRAATGVVDYNTWLAMGFSSWQWYYADSYVTPVRVNIASTRSDCIETMISTAYSYLGTRYVWCAAARPGEGIDCSGLVMQCLYSAGIDPLPAGSHVYALPAYERTSAIIWNSAKFKHVPYAYRQRGDILCYVGHVSIYLGGGRMIEALPGGVRISPVRTQNLRGVVRPFV